MKRRRFIAIMLMLCFSLSLMSGCFLSRLGKFTYFEQDGYAFRILFSYDAVLCTGFKEGYFEKEVTIPTKFERSEDWYLGGIDLNAFSNTEIEKLYILDKDSIAGVTINFQAFAFCLKLDTVELDIPSCCISKQAFEGCSSLKTLDLSKIESILIREQAFKDCTSLKNVLIGEIVPEWGMEAWLDDEAFVNCADGFELTLRSKNPPLYSDGHYKKDADGNILDEYVYSMDESDWNPFEGIEDFKIFVPAEAVETYKTALGWRLYADHIFPIAE